MSFPDPTQFAQSPRSLASRTPRLAAVPLAVVLLSGVANAAATEPEFALVVRDHRFVPDEIVIPAGTRVRIVVENQDTTPEEFDSHALNREKMIVGRSKATIYIGPLSSGRYEFIGEFNAATARGVVIVK